MAAFRDDAAGQNTYPGDVSSVSRAQSGMFCLHTRNPEFRCVAIRFQETQHSFSRRRSTRSAGRCQDGGNCCRPRGLASLAGAAVQMAEREARRQKPSISGGLSPDAESPRTPAVSRQVVNRKDHFHPMTGAAARCGTSLQRSPRRRSPVSSARAVMKA
jgi:hypothetical protein